MVDEAMNPDDVAKRAMQIAARAEELARHAHERAGIDEQLAQLEAELDALDAEEAGLEGEAEGARDDSGVSGGPTIGWADQFTERISGLGDRIGALVENVTNAAAHTIEASLDDTEVIEERSLPVQAAGRVRIDSDGGSVRIRGCAEPAVSVVARGRRGGEQPHLLEVTERSGTVEITCRSRSWRRRRGVRLDVSVPIGSDLEVVTGGGNIRADGVAGAADIKTGGGSITLSGAQGEAHVTTGGGSIAVGDIDGALTASTGGGSVQVDGRLRGASRIRTGGGSITVRLADDSHIRVYAVGTGAFTDVDGLHAHGGRITGQVGGGGDGELRASTGGGTVSITR